MAGRRKKKRRTGGASRGGRLGVLPPGTRRMAFETNDDAGDLRVAEARLLRKMHAAGGEAVLPLAEELNRVSKKMRERGMNPRTGLGSARGGSCGGRGLSCGVVDRSVRVSLGGLGSLPAVHKAEFRIAARNVDRAHADLQRAMREGNCQRAWALQAQINFWAGKAQDSWDSLSRTPMGRDSRLRQKLVTKVKEANTQFVSCVAKPTPVVRSFVTSPPVRRFQVVPYGR